MITFDDILSKGGVFKNMEVLSPHYIPDVLPHREKEIEVIMRTVAPALRNVKPKNLFLYGKTGTGKTSCSKHVMEQFNGMRRNAIMRYMNCRIYNTRYKILFKIAEELDKGQVKMGYPHTHLYEILLEWIEENNRHLIIILDEIDMIKDVDDLIYTLTRINDELDRGSVSILGISNRLHFKEKLDPRSKSALYEKELVFKPYNANQLYEIIKQRAKEAFHEGAIEDSALRIAAALAARETGDARYALKLIQKAGMLAEEREDPKVTDKHVELARKSVDNDLVGEAVSSLPQQEQIVLYSIALLHINGGEYKRLGEVEDEVFTSGEVYENYKRVCKELGVDARVPRSVSEFLKDLDMLGLITMKFSGKGTRGQTRLIKIAYDPYMIKKIIGELLIK